MGRFFLTPEREAIDTRLRLYGKRHWAVGAEIKLDQAVHAEHIELAMAFGREIYGQLDPRIVVTDLV